MGWIWGLAAIAGACCLATTVVFSPGYMSADSISQLKQATGDEPLNDWHPPVMSLVWRALIAVTGTPATMAVLQSALLWAALWAIAWCVWDLTASRAGSLAVLGLGLTPHVLTFVGVVWKDVHMAFALLATSALALAGRRLGTGRSTLRWVLLGLGVLFLAYAILVRKNAIFAAVPVFVMLVLALWGRPGRRIWLISAAALAVGLLVPGVAISSIERPARTSQGSQIMLDDLLHVLSPDELRSAAVSPELRDRLATAAKECHRIKSLSNSYFTCWERDTNGLSADSDQLTSLWTSEMTTHLPGYLQYRLRLFSELLFQGSHEYQSGIIANTAGLRTSHPRLEATLGTYVKGAVQDLPFLFAGWFWLAVALVLSIRPGRGRFSMPVRALGVSSALYVLGYLPIMPATDFRYFYWPAIAGTLGLLLSWLGRGAPRPPGGSGVTNGRLVTRHRPKDAMNRPLTG
ncbi:hypothetical protein [Streptomyces adelaidensis]|uniref:hypothetical protein n=1 Tax=Streptomyces adelaidensis TaxID=2796465 RepID=UPI001F31BFD6|nr:hypothetical protein [Streptomyces adelaidensis]